MPAKQRDNVRKLALLVYGNDSECATTTGLPIDRDVLRVGLRDGIVSGSHLWRMVQRWEVQPDLDQIGVPGIATNTDVVVTRLFLGRLAKDVACNQVRAVVGGGGGGRCDDLRYLEALTKRPAMIAVWIGV